jgi:hypothetical protein
MAAKKGTYVIYVSVAIALVFLLVLVILFIHYSNKARQAKQLDPLPPDPEATANRYRFLYAPLVVGSLIGGIAIALFFILRSTWKVKTCLQVQIEQNKQLFQEKTTSSSSSSSSSATYTTNTNCGTYGNVCDTSGGQTCSAQTNKCVCQVQNTAYCGPGIGCVDVISDENHCGACGNVCTPGEACMNGVCLCLGDVCTGVCVDLRTDNDNCGACDRQCSVGFTCVDGQCVLASQYVPDTQTDVLNCGRLDNRCYGVGAQCCDGKCSIRTSDINNCGACGTVCDTQNGEQCCFGRCVDVQNDVQNCGTCGAACPVGLYCYQGRCISLGTNDHCSGIGDLCPPGTNCRNGACVSTTDSNVNCGASQANCFELYGSNEGKCFNNTTCLDSKNSASGCLAFSSEPRMLTYITWDSKTNAQYIKTSCLTPSAWLQAVKYCNYIVTAPYNDPLTLTVQVPMNGALCSPSNPVLSAPVNWASTVYTNTPVPPANCDPVFLPNQGGSLCCNGVLTNPQNDNNNCGQCGVDCKQIYGSDGACKDGVCYDTRISSNACGSVLAVCTNGGICQSGVCVASSLVNSSTNANCAGAVCAAGENCCGGRCRNYQTDEIACGTCGNQCPYGYTCLNGLCVDLRQSNTLCYKPPDNQDPINSSSATPVTCGPGQVCSNGTCTTIGTLTNCSGVSDNCSTRYGIYGACVGGTCVRTQFNNSSCGTNGSYVACAATEQCVNGLCVPGMSTNCGTILTCVFGQFCANNTCVSCVGPTCGSCGSTGVTCSSSQQCCRGTCITPSSDPNNCGGCGIVCVPGKTCSGGVCV